ncbi:MAG: C40 family peptidase [Pirellulaceae bacterium]
MAGDILLYRVTDSLRSSHSALIRKLDGTEVSHAGLFVDGCVAEALATGEHAGLGTQPLADSIVGCDWVAVCRMQNVPGDMQPVLGTARIYLDQGNRYAYGQILLLAMICLTRKLELSNPLLRRIVYSVINNAAAFVRRMQSGGKQPMICSEFVYRSYDETILTDEDDIYTIEIEPLWPTKTRRQPPGRRRRAEKAVATGHIINPDSLVGQLQAEAGDLRMGIGMTKARPAPALPETSDEELNDMIDIYMGEDSGMLSITAAVVAAGPELTMRDLRDAVGAFADSLHDAADAGQKLGTGAKGAPGTRVGATPADTLLEICADFVTPGDLLRSESLVTVGELRP